MADDPKAPDWQGQPAGEHDLPTQRLPGREEPKVPGGAPRSTPPTLKLGTAEAALEARKERAAPRPLLGDRYELRDELGRGGMGVVYRAHDRTLGRDVALKVLQVAGRVDAETIERFQREARAAAALDHPNIVRVHDVGALPDGAPYYTMEMLAGQDLAHAIADAHISPKEAVEAVRQVSLALLYAHQKGILHRDLKPQNIFLRKASSLDPTSDSPTVHAGSPAAVAEVHALLLDFGLAKLAERDLAAHAEGSQGRKSMQSLTRSGEVFGTPAYMPPEQTHGAKDVDARSDIYSLGAALYHALAGRLMFDAASLAELLVKVQRQDPAPPSQFNADVDLDLDTLMLKCLQKDPKDRYQNAGELAEDLKRWLAGDPISARPIGLVGRFWRKARRNKAVAIPVSALSFLLLVGLLTWAGVTFQNHLLYRRAMSETRDLLAAGDLTRALDRVRQALVLAPDDRDVEDLVARIHVARGREAAKTYTDARTEFERLEREEEDPPPRKTAWLHVPEKGTHGGFMARFEAATGMYRAYINDAEWHKSEEDRFRHFPREAMTATKESVYWERDPKSGWRPKGGFAWWTDDVPIFSVSWDDAKDYCDWLTLRTGGGEWTFGLQTEDEWERAARGADGRFLPWGDAFDAAFCRMQDSRVRERRDLLPEPVRLFAIDESPFGVRDVAGGMCEATSTERGNEKQWRIFKGGAWSGDRALCRSASRNSLGPWGVRTIYGLRLFARRTP